jgi:hypothetical protein
VIHRDDAPVETRQQSPQPSVPWVDVTEELQGQSLGSARSRRKLPTELLNIHPARGKIAGVRHVQQIPGKTLSKVFMGG